MLFPLGESMVALLLSLSLTAAPNPLVGRWDNGAGFVLVLQANGSGTLADSSASPPEVLSWKGSAGHLALTQEGETTVYSVALKGETLTLSGGDLEATVTLHRAGAASTPAAAPGPNQPSPSPRANSSNATCPQACQYFLTCAAQLGAVSTANPQVQVACLQECQQSGMTPPQLGAFVSLSCPQAVAFVIAAEQAARGQPQPKRSGGACDGCVRWGDDCMWSSQSNWGPGHYGNRYSGAVVACDSSCCGL